MLKLRMGLLTWMLMGFSAGFSCDFDCTLKRHLDAIQAKDFDAFESTLTKGTRLTLILPNGDLIEDANEYRDLLKDWFEDGGWRLSYTVVAVEKTTDMGYALLLVSYDEDDRNGEPYHLDHYLSLVFKRDGDGWFLVHDQNTKAKLAE